MTERKENVEEEDAKMCKEEKVSELRSSSYLNTLSPLENHVELNVSLQLLHSRRKL